MNDENFEKYKNSIYNKFFVILLIVACIVAVISSMFTYKWITKNNTVLDLKASTTDTANKTQAISKSLENFRSVIDEYYKGDIDEEKLLDSTIKGYVDGLGDKYTTYMPKEEWDEFQESALGNFVGIGIYMTENSDELIEVVSPMEDSPAKKAGIIAGDVIVEVNGESVIGQSTDIVSSKIKGEEGTNVSIKIKRNDEYLTFDLVRENIKIYHVYSEVLENNVGYISLITFDTGCADEFYKKLTELKEKGITKLVIDLRNNTGGIVNESLNIAEMFINKGNKLLITEDNKNNKVTTYAKSDAIVDMDVVVLCNKYTASASEILIGALRDNNIAKIVGTQTYGKGVIQQIFKLKDGGALKITTEEYYTPNETKINKVGITPDVEVELKDGDEDTQLNKAIEFAFSYDDSIIIEEEIKGFEVGCAILGNNNLIIGEVDEINLPNDFFDYNMKYKSSTNRIILPANLSQDERNRIKETALKIYNTLYCEGFARVDMFYTENKEIIFNEVNTIPGCTSHSRFPSMLNYIGYDFSKMIDTIIELGMNRKKS